MVWTVWFGGLIACVTVAELAELREEGAVEFEAATWREAKELRDSQYGASREDLISGFSEDGEPVFGPA